MITDKRLQKLKRVAQSRQNMTVVLENVHDPHNIGAVMRTCDAVGIYEIFVIYTESHLNADRLVNFKGSSTGVKKWIDVHLYRSIDACVQHVKKDYDNLFATHLAVDSKSIYDTDFTSSCAFVFGNEHAGVSEALLKHCNANILIPQYGMVQSLNISVACAITIYESLRQREIKHMYQYDFGLLKNKRTIIEKKYLDIHLSKYGFKSEDLKQD